MNLSLPKDRRPLLLLFPFYSWRDRDLPGATQWISGRASIKIHGLQTLCTLLETTLPCSQRCWETTALTNLVYCCKCSVNPGQPKLIIHKLRHTVNSRLPEYWVYRHIKRLILESSVYKRVLNLVHACLGECLSYQDTGGSRAGNLLFRGVGAGT